MGEEGRKRQRYAEERLKELAVQDPAATVAARTRLAGRMGRLLGQMGASGELYEAEPRDVVVLLTTLDEGGKTPVHVEGCEYWGTENRAECKCVCPRRAGAGSINTTYGKLRGIFRDLGMTGPWDSRIRVGNPCDSAEVKRYVDLVGKEQLQAGVGGRKAGLIHEELFQQLRQLCLGEWATVAEKHLVGAVEKARDLLFLTVLWHTGMRAADALRLWGSQVRKLGKGKEEEWEILGGREKAAKVLGSGRRYAFTGGTARRHLSDAWCALKGSALDVGLGDDGKGLFRRVRERDDGRVVWGKIVEWAEMSSRFTTLKGKLGWPPEITLHSFHGSRAWREKEEGVTREQTCASMGWSQGMYDHYVLGRTAWRRLDIERWQKERALEGRE